MLMTAVTKKKITINSPKLWRPLIDIRDVIEAYRLAIECDSDISGIFNLSGVNLTIGTLGKLIYNKLKDIGMDIDLEILDIHDFRNYKVNIDKIQDELQFEPKYLPKDSIDEILSLGGKYDQGLYWGSPEVAKLDEDKYYNIRVFKEVIKNEGLYNRRNGITRK